jgi:hypothetical protein
MFSPNDAEVLQSPIRKADAKTRSADEVIGYCKAENVFEARGYR